MSARIKQERVRLTSQHRDGSLMFPGVWVLTWVSAAWGWLLVAMEPEEQVKP